MFGVSGLKTKQMYLSTNDKKSPKYSHYDSIWLSTSTCHNLQKIVLWSCSKEEICQYPTAHLYSLQNWIVVITWLGNQDFGFTQKWWLDYVITLLLLEFYWCCMMHSIIKIQELDVEVAIPWDCRRMLFLHIPLSLYIINGISNALLFVNC